MQEPVIPDPAKLIGAGAGICGIDAEKEVDGVSVPGGRLSPPVDDLCDAVAPFPPGKSAGRQFVFTVYFHGLVDKFCHGRIPVRSREFYYIEQLYYCQET